MTMSPDFSTVAAGYGDGSIRQTNTTRKKTLSLELRAALMMPIIESNVIIKPAKYCRRTWKISTGVMEVTFTGHKTAVTALRLALDSPSREAAIEYMN